jgi:hypothetical protein
VRQSPDQAVRFHILGLQTYGVISGLTLGWLQSKKIGY